jgi:hypothetical protein
MLVFGDYLAGKAASRVVGESCPGVGVGSGCTEASRAGRGGVAKPCRTIACKKGWRRYGLL